MKLPVKIVALVTILINSISFKTSAQLCQGSLGDPVVNITFGAGANPGPPLSNNITNYSYFSGDCPDDGFYTIANATYNCFGGTWHSVSQDHTPGDVNGYMMVVNASFNPGDFFVKTVDGLCPNTTYEFASWILNVLQPFACDGMGIKPNITFSIEDPSGKIIKSYQTGDLPTSPDWAQYGFYFSTTPGISSVVLRMTNNAPGGCGNDLLLDDITFRACGPLVTANLVGFGDSANVCTGDTTTFTITANVSSGYNDPVYQWQYSTNNGTSWANIPGATDTTYVRPANGITNDYLYRLGVAQRTNTGVTGCSIYSNVILIGVKKFPVPSATSYGNCTGDTLSLSAEDGIIFSWSGPLGFVSDKQFPVIPVAVIANGGNYYVKVTSSAGCSTLDSTLASINSKPVVQVSDDAEICEGSSIQLNSTGTNIMSYSWAPVTVISNPAIPNPIAYPIQSTRYILTVANKECKVKDSVLITIDKKPVADAGPGKVIIQGQPVTLDGAAGGTDVTYLWTPPEFITAAETLNPVVNPPLNKLYTLHVLSNKGCGTATDSVLVKVFKKLYIPNAFTPNGDGINDTWFIETLQAYPGAGVKVYNRYGQIVFDNHGTNKSWDGKFKGVMLTSGSYVYIIDLKNNGQIVKGIVNIIL